MRLNLGPSGWPYASRVSWWPMNCSKSSWEVWMVAMVVLGGVEDALRPHRLTLQHEGGVEL